MMNGGEAADQMVSYAFKGGEVILRLTGDGAKHLAIYLANLLKPGRPQARAGQTLKHMIADGKELSVQRIDVSQIPYFNARAKKYGVMFVAVRGHQSAGWQVRHHVPHGGRGACQTHFRPPRDFRAPRRRHIKSDILRAKGKDPTQARKGAGVSPSAPASPGQRQYREE